MSQAVKNIRIEDFSYELPDERIARYPLNPRDSSKLLIYNGHEISESHYRNVGDYLPNDTLLLFNQTRVVQARLIFPKNENTNIEVLCLEPMDLPDLQQAMQSSSPIRYKCLVGGARKWKSGKLAMTSAVGTVLYAEKIERLEGSFCIEFSWEGNKHFAEILEEFGRTPLPPYLNRAAEEKDKSTYQTTYAKLDGSVAAPTAGLHFTENLLEQLKTKGVQEEFITLHVGAGTFKPVSSDTMEEHEMHAEEFFVEKSVVETLLKNLYKNVIPVGTTSMRALESIYWLGAKLLVNPKLNDYHITQWEPYQNEANPQAEDALKAVLNHLNQKSADMLIAKTQLIIAPGYKHHICKGLLTNFHQPKSTLLLLVASLIGDRWKDIYSYALQNDFRFLSYGDGCLILPHSIKNN